MVVMFLSDDFPEKATLRLCMRVCACAQNTVVMGIQ